MAEAAVTLLPGEQVVFETRRHLKVLAVPFALMVVGFCVTGVLAAKVSLPMAVVGLAFTTSPFLLEYLQREQTQIVLTNQRVYVSAGVLAKRFDEVLLPRISAVDLEQSFLGRLLGYGTVTVHGMGAREELFKDVKNPYELRLQIEQRLRGGRKS